MYHSIITRDSQPVRQLPRRAPFALREEIKMIGEILKADGFKSLAAHGPVLLCWSERKTTHFASVLITDD